MEFNRIVAACVVVTAAGWALERGLKQAAEKNRQREEYRVYENAGGLLLTIMIALIVLLFICRAVYPEYLNGKNSLFFYAIGICAIVNLVREIFLFLQCGLRSPPWRFRTGTEEEEYRRREYPGFM